jgi:putative ABC transport system permease protein
VEGLKEGGAVTPGRRRQLFRRSLAVAQVALSMTSLVGAVLYTEYLFRIANADRGFRSGNVLTARADLAATRMGETQRKQFYRSVVDRLEGMPQVRSAGWTTFLPMSGTGGGNRRSIEVSGASDAGIQAASIIVDAISPGFLKTLAIPVVAGRDFGWSDDERSQPVVIVNEKFVERYIRGNPIGAMLRLGLQWRTIIGVHRNYVYRHPNAPQWPAAFVPLAQEEDSHAVIDVSTNPDPLQLVTALREAIREFSPNIAIAQIMTMEQNVSGQLADTRLATQGLVVFSVLASALAAMGLYGVLATFVSQRRREFSIMIATGATPAHLRAAVMRHGMRLALFGVSVGTILSLGVAQLLKASITGIRPFDPRTYLAAGVIVSAISILAVLLPSWRAARADPAVALRCE